MTDEHGPGWRPRCAECGKGMRWEECPNCADVETAGVCPTCGGECGLWVCGCPAWMGPDGYYVGVAVYDYSGAEEVSE